MIVDVSLIINTIYRPEGIDDEIYKDYENSLSSKEFEDFKKEYGIEKKDKSQAEIFKEFREKEIPGTTIRYVSSSKTSSRATISEYPSNKDNKVTAKNVLEVIDKTQKNSEADKSKKVVSSKTNNGGSKKEQSSQNGCGKIMSCNSNLPPAKSSSNPSCGVIMSCAK